MKYIIAIMGPSQSGKSKIIEKIINSKCEGFTPVLIRKETNRKYRKEEQILIDEGNEGKVDVKKVDEFSADLIYQTYGKRTGIKISELIEIANDGFTPVVIINDIIALKKLKKECEKIQDFCVISIFLFRKIPVRNDFFSVSKERGNVPEKETEQRYEKAKTVYRIYIENIYSFDYILLNVKNYENFTDNKDTIIDKQILSIRDNIILQEKRPPNREKKDNPVLYIIAGNAASGKDELIRAANDLGKLYVDIVPKYTSRNQQSDDGSEMICRFVVDEDYKKNLVKNINDILSYIENNLINNKELNKSYDNFEEMLTNNKKYCEYKEEKDDNKALELYQNGVKKYLWWKLLDDFNNIKIITKRINEFENELEKDGYKDFFPWAGRRDDSPLGYIENKNYNSMIDAKEKLKERFLEYTANQVYKYIIDLKKIDDGFANNRSQVLVLSDVETIKKLKKRYGDQVIVIYCHSQIDETEFKKNTTDANIEQKIKKFSKQLEEFAENYSIYRHVIIYAENEIGHESDGRQEDLIDQLFRLFMAYEEQRL